jgi:hypothetical protein
LALPCGLLFIACIPAAMPGPQFPLCL